MSNSLSPFISNNNLQGPFSPTQITYMGQGPSSSAGCHKVSLYPMSPKAGWVDAWCLPFWLSGYQPYASIWTFYPYFIGTYTGAAGNITCETSHSLRFNQYRWDLNASQDEVSISVSKTYSSCPSANELSLTTEELLEKETYYELGLPEGTGAPTHDFRVLSKLFNHTVQGLCQKLTLLHRGPFSDLFGHCRTSYDGLAQSFSAKDLTDAAPVYYCPLANNYSSLSVVFRVLRSYEQGVDASAKVKHSYIRCEDIPNTPQKSAAYKAKPSMILGLALLVLAALQIKA